MQQPKLNSLNGNYLITYCIVLWVRNEGRLWPSDSLLSCSNLMRLPGGIQLLTGWSGSSKKASLTSQSPWQVCLENRVQWSFQQGGFRVISHFCMMAQGSWKFVLRHLGGDCKTSYDIVSEFSEHHFHHLLFVKQVRPCSHWQPQQRVHPYLF